MFNPPLLSDGLDVHLDIIGRSGCHSVGVVEVRLFSYLSLAIKTVGKPYVRLGYVAMC